MNAQKPTDTVRALIDGDKGLVAMDESIPTNILQLMKCAAPQRQKGNR
jgi:hypothetical protein